MTSNGKFWKESASLIILARNGKGGIKHDNCDYKALVLKRSAKTGFMPSTTVFPGGQIEKCDSSRDWLALYESLGVSLKTLSDVTAVNGERPPIFQNIQNSDDLKRDVSLRISSIREAFEELGVLICRDKKDIESLTHSTPFATFKSDFDVKYWQKKVHEDPTQFLELCHELSLLPDVWGTHEWSAWLTPSAYTGRRFEAAFFLAALNETPEVFAESNEVQCYKWLSPAELMTAHNNEEQWLPPPQHYELSRMVCVPELDTLAKFSEERSSKGSKLFYPIFVNAKDGTIHLLPGDTDYPDKPNYQTGEGDAVHRPDVLMRDQRPVGPVHRTEHTKSFFDLKLIMEDFEPHCGHLRPASFSRHIHKL